MKNAYNFSKDHEERPDFKNRQFIWWKNTYFALWYSVSSLQFSSVTQSCLTLCNPMDHSMPGHPVHHHSWSLLKLMSIELVMPSNHLTFCHPLLPPSIPIITLNVNGLIAQTKIHRLARWMKTYALPHTTSLCLAPQIVCNYFTLLS